MDFRLRASPKQFSKMLEFMETHGDLSRPQPGAQGRLTTERLWSELSELLNTVGGRGVIKSLDKWKRVWSDWKTKTKKKAFVINRSTGRGSIIKKPLNTLEKRVLKIIGIEVKSGYQEIEKGGCQVVSPTQTTTSPRPSVSPEPSLSDHQPFTSQASGSITSEYIKSPCPSTPRRTSPGPSMPRKRALRRWRLQTPFEGATAFLMRLELGRMRLEEKRRQRQHEREMERLRVEALRIEMEGRRTAVFEEMANTANNILGIISQCVNGRPRVDILL